MADVAQTKLEGTGNSDIWEFVFDATNKTIANLKLDPEKETTIAITTSGSATVSVDLFFEDPDNAGSTSFTFESAAATSGSNDWVKSALGPLSGLDLTGTVTGGDGATIQILQAQKKGS